MLNSRAENLTQDLCMDMHDSYARTKTSKNPIVHRSKPFKSASGLILYHHPKKYFTPMYPTAGTAAIPAIAGSPSTAAPPIAALWAAAYHDPAVTPALPILQHNATIMNWSLAIVENYQELSTNWSCNNKVPIHQSSNG
jgi:hypothetical protein